MNLRPSGYEPDELPDCSTPRLFLCLWRSPVAVFFVLAASGFVGRRTEGSALRWLCEASALVVLAAAFCERFVAFWCLGLCLCFEDLAATYSPTP